MKKVVLLLLLVPLSAAAFFYLFVFPALVATGVLERSWLTMAFSAFLYFQLWMLVAEYLYQSVAGLYGFRKKSLLPFLKAHFIPHQDTKENLVIITVAASLSWVIAVYGFTLAYTFTSAYDSGAFSEAGLSLFDSFYFSFTTAAGAGDGVIVPTSTVAKLLVMLQICFNFLYVAFILTPERNRTNRSTRHLRRTSRLGAGDRRC